MRPWRCSLVVCQHACACWERSSPLCTWEATIHPRGKSEACRQVDGIVPHLDPFTALTVVAPTLNPLYPHVRAHPATASTQPAPAPTTSDEEPDEAQPSTASARDEPPTGAAAPTATNRYLELLREITHRTGRLVAAWQVGGGRHPPCAWRRFSRRHLADLLPVKRQLGMCLQHIRHTRLPHTALAYAC